MLIIWTINLCILSNYFYMQVYRQHTIACLSLNFTLIAHHLMYFCWRRFGWMFSAIAIDELSQRMFTSIRNGVE